MKLPTSLQTASTLIFFMLACGFAAAQEKDPFTRKAADSETTAANSENVSMIALGLEMIEVDESTLRAWESEGLNWNNWRKKAQALIESGDATFLDSSVCLFRSGQRAKIENSLGLYFPIKEEVVEGDLAAPLFPSVFNRNELGLILEADPVLSAGGDQLSLAIAVEWSSYGGEDLEARTPTERSLEADVVSPIFKENKITNQFDLSVGNYQLMTQFAGRAKGTSTLVFIHFDLISVPPLQDLEKLDGQSDVSFRIHVVDVPVTTWEGWVSKHDLPSLMDGGAWDKVSEVLAEGEGASVQYTSVLETKSGTRAKVEKIKEMQFDTEFLAPKTEGGHAEPAGRESFNLGMSWEIDPVLGNNGMVDINFALEINSLSGYSVSYRKLEGDSWIPTVQFPKLFTNRITSSAVLHETMHLLAGVMTPPLEDGSLDHSRKRLFFIHNETFTSQ